MSLGRWHFYLLLILVLFSCVLPIEKQPNILFIAVDDLRPQLGIYGYEFMKTPNLDRLGQTGYVFNRHYAQAPTCGASRCALLSGLLPREPFQKGNNAIKRMFADSILGPIKSYPQQFRENGYKTIALGKISHFVDGKLYAYDASGDGSPEMPNAWDESWGPIGKWGTAWNSFFGYSDGTNRNTLKNQVPPFEKGNGPDSIFPDGLITLKTLTTLNNLAKEPDQPFLLGVGFFKPHLPFNSPAKYWEFYDDDLPLSPNQNLPYNVSDRSIHNSGEMFNGYKIQEETGGRGVVLDQNYARKLRKAYYSAVSYIDEQIGIIIKELERLNLTENTIIVVWGDHGWHLGDHTVWGKHTLLERSLRSTLLFKIPDATRDENHIEGIVETIDLFPTLGELAGIELEQRDGESFAPLFYDEPWQSKGYARSYNNSGLSLRTDHVRYNLFSDKRIPDEELFLYPQDSFEMKNVYPDFPDLRDSLKVNIPY
jgi:arylsulfatase A-like enzyme